MVSRCVQRYYIYQDIVSMVCRTNICAPAHTFLLVAESVDLPIGGGGIMSQLEVPTGLGSGERYFETGT